MNTTEPRPTLVDRIRKMAALEVLGQVIGVTGPVVKARGVNAVVGQQVDLWSGNSQKPIQAEVIGLDGETVLLMALKTLEGVGPGSFVSARGNDPRVPVGDEFLGRVIDGMGRPMDGKALPLLSEHRSLRGESPRPLDRARITRPFSTGIQVVDSMLTTGSGQRLGIFAGPGIGKSTLLSMMARHANVDACVVALVGERGREVREFVEDAISEENRERTVVVAATGDEAPLVRIRGALLATTLAEYYRSQGRQVLFLLDSLTRYAMALREVGLAAGELPASKGYPPSVFVELAKILERAGNDRHGSITGIFTVLVEGDDMSDPVADSTQALLDGHILLSREMANRGVYPAVDVLRSASRLMTQVVSKEHLDVSRKAVSLLAAYSRAEDLIRIGAYQAGSDPDVDRARKFVPMFERFVTQEVSEHSNIPKAIQGLTELIKKMGAGP
ncbi:MAG: FliI/YscN family ATPase [Proteobacteria bacterium]|nr:FliI/YscN family ATPase [Pseudomonadota bacterium]